MKCQFIGKNCTGDANDVQQSPPVPGRQQEINKATMMTCNFAKTTATTRFNITCLGGCTNIISVGFLTVGVKHSLYKQNIMLSSW